MKRLLIAATGVFLLGAGAAHFAGVASAQGSAGNVPNALQGFSANRDQPIAIEANSLEVRDREKIATFAGDVRVVQGDTRLRARQVLVFYDNDGAAPAQGSASARTQPQAVSGMPGSPGGNSQIRRIEARGTVVITTREQTATGELGVFDMRANTFTLSGNVVLNQGQNTLRGERVVVDLTTGVSRVESGAVGNPGRVQGLFTPGQGAQGGSGAAPGTAPASAQQPASPPGQRPAPQPQQRPTQSTAQPATPR